MPASVPQRSPCVDAVLRGDEAAVRSWLERGGGANNARENGEVTGVTLLIDAATYGHERVAALLLQHGAEVDMQSSVGVTSKKVVPCSSALMCATNIGHERVVELLIRHGAEVDLQDSNGVTALMAAATNGHERVVELLL